MNSQSKFKNHRRLYKLFTEISSQAQLNAILPSVHSVPVMGTICAGTGRICEDDYQGHFVNLNCIS